MKSSGEFRFLIADSRLKQIPEFRSTKDVPLAFRVQTLDLRLTKNNGVIA